MCLTVKENIFHFVYFAQPHPQMDGRKISMISKRRRIRRSASQCWPLVNVAGALVCLSVIVHVVVQMMLVQTLMLCVGQNPHAECVYAWQSCQHTGAIKANSQEFAISVNARVQMGRMLTKPIAKPMQPLVGLQAKGRKAKAICIQHAETCGRVGACERKGIRMKSLKHIGIHIIMKIMKIIII